MRSRTEKEARPLSTLNSAPLTKARARLRNVVNSVYPAEIPTYILGPLTVNSTSVKVTPRIPFATTEALLPQSIQRGILVINASGGCTARVLTRTMTRAPVFAAESLVHAIAVRDTIQGGIDDLAAVAGQTTQHGKLHSHQCWVVGHLIFVRFGFETGDAMGMNMVTIATQAMCEWIVRKTKARVVSLSSNMCADKKASAVNPILGRGRWTVAESCVPSEVLKTILKTIPSSIVEIVSAKDHVGSGLACSSGYMNAHFANIVAGIFAATGQDLAQVVESSMGTVLAGIEANGDLRFSVTLPNLEVGTVGGGTNQPYALKALRMLGCAGGGSPPGSNADRLAEAIAATCLAGELSLLASLAEGSLARAHAKHRRVRR